MRRRHVLVRMPLILIRSDAVKIQLPDPAIEPTMTVPRASRVVGVSIRAGYDAVARSEWPTIRIGRSVRVLTAKFLRQYGLDDDRDASRVGAA